MLEMPSSMTPSDSPLLAQNADSNTLESGLNSIVPKLLNFTNPWFLRGGHLQTLVGYYRGGKLPYLPTERLEVDLCDGDRLLVHASTPENWQPGGPCAIMLHGLTGSHRSAHVARIAVDLFQRGWRIGRVDLRGAGDGFALARRLYHVGRSGDIVHAAKAFMEQAPRSPLVVIGFSLGGNIALKLALESAGPDLPQLQAVAAVCPPVDPAACVRRVCMGRFRIYDRLFYRELRLDWERRCLLFPDLPQIVLPKRGTLRVFDDMITAPLNGYSDSEDYYQDNATAGRLGDMPIPAIIVAAADDPVVTIEPLAELARKGAHPSHLQLELTSGGGHLGYVGRGKSMLNWAEQRVVEWLISRF